MKANFRPGWARDMNAGRLLLATLVSAACSGAYAQETPAAPTPEEGEVIVVTGSRIARDLADASTPISVIGAEEIRLSGTMNVDKVLGDQPQFVQATNGGNTANTVPAGSAAGAAYANLRGFGPTRSLTLVNGRRFAIFGPEQVTDLNTIPAALVKRTEVVTGGSSAVYGSDAITGVVNFIMRDDFEGFETGAQYGFDSSTNSPIFNVDLTAGLNFSEGRGNFVASLNYYKREGFTRDERGDWAELPYGEACVTQESWSDSMIGVANGASAANCAASGGKMGFVFAGSGDIPNGRFTLTNAQLANAGVQTALANAGLAGLGANGFTFNDDGALGSQRLVNRPADDFNLTKFNYLQVPAERYMANIFTHFDFTDRVTGYAELHYSKNKVDQQLTQSNINATSLINVDNPYLDADMRALLVALDAAEAPTTTLPAQGSLVQTTTQNDGLAIINGGRRLVELPFRHNVDDHDVYRVAVGIRGDLGDASEKWFRNLKYDVYYSYARSEDTSTQDGAASRSQYAMALLRPNPTTDPIANVFGQSLTPAAVDAIAIHSVNTTNAEQSIASASLTGDAFDTWAGAVGFSFGLEWRKAEAEYLPDSYLRSGDVAGFNAGQPTAGDVTATEIFGEVRVPILADLPGVQNLSLNGGFRTSDYDLDGVGRVNTYLYGMDWRIADELKVRAQFQHAIRAPNIGDLYGGQQLNFPTLVDPCGNQNINQQTPEVRAVCIATGVPAASVFTQGVQPNNTVPVVSGGNPDLQEESSDTFTFGFVITPIESLYISIDYFDISLDDAIAPIAGGAQNVLNLCYYTVQDPNSALCQNVHRDPSTGAITTPFSINTGQANIGGLDTKGVDMNATYGWDAGFGMNGASRFEFSSAWTWTKEFTVTPVADLPLQNACVGFYGSTCGEPIPEWKGITRLTWNTGPLGVSLRHRYIASVYTDRFITALNNNQMPNPSTWTNPGFPAFNYFDLSGTYDFGEKIKVYAGVNNITDQDPPIVAGFGGYGNTFPATYDYAGMTFFFGVNAKF
ncbi:MAG TPA: TonB-dependent receptor [Steroidobacteraceae bacterium]|nr:TonB-dependent receptor [Steroidobacteraceae bacterium]